MWCWWAVVWWRCTFDKLRLVNTAELLSPSALLDLWPTDPIAGDGELWPPARDPAPGDNDLSRDLGWPAGDGDLTQISRWWLVLTADCVLWSSAVGCRVRLFLFFLVDAGVSGVRCLGGDDVERLGGRPVNVTSQQWAWLSDHVTVTDRWPTKAGTFIDSRIQPRCATYLLVFFSEQNVVGIDAVVAAVITVHRVMNCFIVKKRRHPQDWWK